ncbi:MAG: hypothetical protein ABSC20_11600 [Candidatus Bathyarchaeia archaeon]|jgi:hypothetical protein
MSEYIGVIGVITGSIGTATGIIALIRIYRKEKPNLKIEKVESSHNFTHNPSEKTHINFWAKFHVSNLGDRGTRINDIILSFRVDSKDYILKKQDFFRVPSVGLSAKIEKSIWLEAHDSSYFQVQFIQEYDSTEKEQIDCNFKIIHTHGSKYAKITSVLTTEHNL